MSTDASRPYGDRPPIRPGDRIAVKIGDEIILGTADAKGAIIGAPEQFTFTPDGEPRPVYDWIEAMADWMESGGGSYSVHVDAAAKPTVEPIPYDEMRRLCGLDPAVKAYCARRDMQKSFSQLGKAMNQMASDLAKGFERFADALIASKPKHTPPMWAIDVSKRKPDKRSGRRVK